jgi:hypothetical protein
MDPIDAVIHKRLLARGYTYQRMIGHKGVIQDEYLSRRIVIIIVPAGSSDVNPEITLYPYDMSPDTAPGFEGEE